VADGNPPGSGQSQAPRLLSGRVHLPLQPTEIKKPRQALLSPGAAGRCGRASPLRSNRPPDLKKNNGRTTTCWAYLSEADTHLGGIGDAGDGVRRRGAHLPHLRQVGAAHERGTVLGVERQQRKGARSGAFRHGFGNDGVGGCIQAHEQGQIVQPARQTALGRGGQTGEIGRIDAGGVVDARIVARDAVRIVVLRAAAA